PQQRILGTRPDATLIHLPVARLDGKPAAVGFLHPGVRRRLQAAAEGVHQRLAATPPAFTAAVAALDTHAERGRLARGGAHGVPPPAAALPGGEHAAARDALGMVRLTAE